MKPSILIIEDEKLVREGLVRTLSTHYTTFHASNNIEAFEIINDCSDIMVIVSDLKIPEEEGLKLLEKIRLENRNIRVIFLTAFSSIETAIDAIRRGAFDYMPKPVDLKKLRSTIKKAIEDNHANCNGTLNKL
jgi:DNA-binding NtrC family response regulator